MLSTLTLLLLVTCVPAALGEEDEEEWNTEIINGGLFSGSEDIEGNVPPNCGVRKCVSDAECVDDVCACKYPLYGDGYIHCTDSDKVICSIFGDPHIHPFNGLSHAGFPWPCRSQFAYVTTGGRYTCAVNVHSQNIQYKGRFFPQAFDAILSITVPGLTTIANIFKLGVERDGIYMLDARGERNDILHFPSSNSATLIDGVSITCSFDTENNFAILRIDGCDIEIRLRPVDPAQAEGAQSQIPAIIIHAPNRTTMHHLETGSEFMLCGSENDGPNTFIDRANEYGFGPDRVNEGLIYAMLERDIPQVSPGDAQWTPIQYRQQCKNMKKFWETRSRKRSAFELCIPFLSDPALRQCIGRKKKNNDPFKVFYRCFAAVSHDSPKPKHMKDCRKARRIAEKQKGKCEGFQESRFDWTCDDVMVPIVEE